MLGQLALCGSVVSCNAALLPKNLWTYCLIMGTGVYVTVSEDLANRLLDDGFSQAGGKRGAGTVLADGANLVTVLVGSHEITRLVRHLWMSAHRRGAAFDSGASAISETRVIIERDGRRVSIALQQEGFGDDGPPEKVVQGMSALLQALSGPVSKTPRC
jgi:hypothetical protein